jgi:hypothetical protein
MSEEKINPAAIVREYFPNADDKEVHDILWSRTAFPFDCTRLREQLASAKALADAGKVQCDFCESEAAPGESLCKGCAEGMAAIRASRDQH